MNIIIPIVIVSVILVLLLFINSYKYSKTLSKDFKYEDFLKDEEDLVN